MCKKTHYKYLLLIVLAIVASCKTQSNDDVEFKKSIVKRSSLQLEKIGKLLIESGNGNNILARPSNKIQISPNGSRVGFYDYIHHHFILTNKNGELRKTFGKQGRGPKELSQVLGWDFDEYNNIVAYDEGQRLFKIINLDNSQFKNNSIEYGNNAVFVNSKDTKIQDSLIYKGIIQAEYSSNPQNSNMIGVFNYDGNLKKSFALYDPYITVSNNYTIQPYFDIDFEQGKVFTTHDNSYRIQIFDLNTKERLGYFGFRSPSYRESQSDIKPTYSRAKIKKLTLNQSFADGIYITSKYILYFFQNLTEEWNETRDPKSKNYYLSIYERNSNAYIFELKLPGYLASVYEEKLFIIENFNPNKFEIGVYKLTD